MARLNLDKIDIDHKYKKTSSGTRSTNVKFSSMNKSKKRQFKPYRGQGKWVKIVKKKSAITLTTAGMSQWNKCVVFSMSVCQSWKKSWWSKKCLIFTAPYDKFNHHKESGWKMNEVLVMIAGLSIYILFIATI